MDMTLAEMTEWTENEENNKYPGTVVNTEYSVYVINVW